VSNQSIILVDFFLLLDVYDKNYVFTESDAYLISALQL
jgi:hypothetical protein